MIGPSFFQVSPEVSTASVEGDDPIPGVFVRSRYWQALEVAFPRREPVVREDIDWFVPRQELPFRLSQARELGFLEFATMGESAPGQPFYLSATQGDLMIDIGVCDTVEEALFFDVHSIAFQLDGRDAPVGYRVHLPADTFQQPPTSLDGVRVWPLSPLALYQIRIAIASQGSFGPLNEKQQASLRRLKETFFPDRSDDELAPSVEPLDEHD